MDGPIPRPEGEIDNGVQKQQIENVLAKPYKKKAKSKEHGKKKDRKKDVVKDHSREKDQLSKDPAQTPGDKQRENDKNIHELLGPPQSNSQDSNSTEPTQVSAQQEGKKLEIQLNDWKTIDDVKTTSEMPP